MTVVTHRRLHTGFGEDFGPRADGFITGHTWEGRGLTVGTVAEFLAPGGPRDWQDSDSVLGSYNLVICADGVVEIVRWDHASGGINPFSDGFKPRAWLYDKVDRDEIHNPNQFSLQLCFFVSKAFCDAHGWPPYMIDAAARAWLEEEQRTKRKQLWTEHADFQPPPSRSDCGPIATALVKKRYAQLIEDDMALSGIEPIINRNARIVAGATSRHTPAFDPTNYDGNKIFTHADAVTRTALFWCEGTNLTLADGSVFDKRTRWLAAHRSSNETLQFYHERDVEALEPIEQSGGDTSALEAKVTALASSFTALQLQSAGLMDEAAKGLQNSANVIRAKKP